MSKVAYVVVQRHGTYEGESVIAVWLQRVQAEEHRNRLNRAVGEWGNYDDPTMNRYAVYEYPLEPPEDEWKVPA